MVELINTWIQLAWAHRWALALKKMQALFVTWTPALCYSNQQRVDVKMKTEKTTTHHFIAADSNFVE